MNAGTGYRWWLSWRNLPFVLLSAAVVYLLVLTGWNKPFDHDEFEHVHSAWYLLQGDVPYRDFFENHNPLLWYLAAPVVALAGDQAGVMLVFRMVMVVMAVGIAVVASLIAVRVSARKETALYCFPILLTCLLFTEKAVEFRPDVPMTLMGTLSVFFLVRHLDTGVAGDLKLCGLFAFLAFLFLQKAAVLTGVLFFFLLVLWIRRKVRGRDVLSFLGWGCAGPVVLCGFYASQGALRDYVLNGYLMHMSKVYSVDPRLMLGESWSLNAGFWVVAAAGVVHGIVLAGKNRKCGVLAILGFLLFLQVFLLRMPWKQYYLQPLVLLAITGGCVLDWIFQMIKAGVAPRLAVLGLIVFHPVKILAGFHLDWNGYQLDAINYVVRHTDPGDVVHDGDIQFNLFRRDLHYFWHSTWEGKNLDLYNRLTGGKYGDFHVCALVAEKKPRAISTVGVHLRECGVIRDYRKDPRYNLYWRADRAMPGVTSDPIRWPVSQLP